jgi:hypothetical protein
VGSEQVTRHAVVACHQLGRSGVAQALDEVGAVAASGHIFAREPARSAAHGRCERFDARIRSKARLDELDLLAHEARGERGRMRTSDRVEARNFSRPRSTSPPLGALSRAR